MFSAGCSNLVEMNGLILCLILAFAACGLGQPYKSTQCPRNSTAMYIESRSCGNPCSATRRCKNPKAQCLCDGACGPVCIADGLTCYLPDTIDHGEIQSLAKGRHRFEDRIFYKCAHGYELIGPSERMCQGDESWSGLDSFCTPEGVRCLRPHFVVENGYADIKENQNSFYLNDTVVYKCLNGYSTSRTSTTSKCNILKTNETEWSPTIKMTCIPKRCAPPITIEDGDYVGSDYSFNKEIIYHCNPGYSLIGWARRFCTSDGTWSGNPPKCEEVQCERPLVPTHGNARFEGTTYKSTVWYECEEGFQLIGTDHSVCSTDGTWSGDAPTCKEIDCGKPAKPGRGRATHVSSTAWNGRVDYECDVGTSSPGMMWAVCALDQDGQPKWSMPPPVCLGDCDTQKLENAIIVPVPGTRNFGRYVNHADSVQMNCKPGHEMLTNADSNKATVLCQDGVWSPHHNCTPARCSCQNIPVPLLKNDKAELVTDCKWDSKILSGVALTLRCNALYPQLKTQGSLKCMFGKWEYESHHCEERSCNVEMDFEHGSVSIIRNGELLALKHSSTIEHGASLHFQCTEGGYELIHNSVVRSDITVKCNNGSFGNFPTCQEESCSCRTLENDLSTKSVAIKDCQHHQISGTVTSLQCAEGYSIPSGEMTALCTKGKWIEVKGSCTAKRCAPPIAIKDGDYVGSDFSFNLEIIYHCNPGFTLIGRASHFCKPDGTWSGHPPKCEESCSCRTLENDLSTKSVAIKDCQHHQISGTITSLRCAEGYSIPSGDMTALCTKGKWIEVKGSCAAKRCAPPIAIEDGYYVGRDFSFNQEIIYNCNPGFTLIGRASHFCKPDGTWSGHPPKCEGDCDIHKLENAIITPFPRTPTYERYVKHNAAVQMECKPGYEMLAAAGSPKATVLCQDGVWSPHHSCIQAKCSCEDIPVPLLKKDNAELATDCQWNSKVLSGIALELRCNLIYPQLKMQGSLECMSGTWKYESLRCEERSCHVQVDFEHGSVSLINKGVLLPLKHSTRVVHGARLHFQCTEEGYELNLGSIVQKEIIVKCNNGSLGRLPICQQAREEIPRIKYTATDFTAPPITAPLPTQQLVTVEPKECTFHPIGGVFAVYEGQKLLKSTDLPHGSVIRYRCQDVYGYSFVGNNSSACIDGKWSNGEPSCRNLIANSANNPPPLHLALMAKRKLVITEDGTVVFPSKEKFIRVVCFTKGPPILTINESCVSHDPFHQHKNLKYSYFYVKWIMLSTKNQTTVRIGCGHPNPPNHEYGLNERVINLKISDVCNAQESKWQIKYNQKVVSSTRREVYIEGDIVSINCTSGSDPKYQIPEFKKCLRNGIWEDGPLTSCERKYKTSLYAPAPKPSFSNM